MSQLLINALETLIENGVSILPHRDPSDDGAIRFKFSSPTRSGDGLRVFMCRIADEVLQSADDSLLADILIDAGEAFSNRDKSQKEATSA